MNVLRPSFPPVNCITTRIRFPPPAAPNVALVSAQTIFASHGGTANPTATVVAPLIRNSRLDTAISLSPTLRRSGAIGLRPVSHCRDGVGMLIQSYEHGTRLNRAETSSAPTISCH